MSILGNFFWLLFGGLFSAFSWFCSGLLCCITVIGIPIGLQCFKIGKMVLTPFGTTIYYGTVSTGSVLLNVLWAIFGGIPLAIASLGAGLLCCITIVGIPFGIQHFKLAGLALFPFGAELRREFY